MNSIKKKNIFICAGGTAGHINPALAFGNFSSEKYNVIYITGKRQLDYKLFKGKEVIHTSSQPLRGRGLAGTVKNLIINFISFLSSLMLICRYRPQFVFGFGGYVCGPICLAGKLLLKKIYIHEQNSVMGITNKIISKFANSIFLNFSQTNIGGELTDSFHVVGNPMLFSKAFKVNKREDTVNILILGGSLGASQINDAVPLLLTNEIGFDFKLKHQVGIGNKIDQRFNNYEQIEYIDDMKSLYEWSNIIICRAGASTVSELKFVGRPTIFIPYPKHADNHQVLNAKSLQDESLFYVAVLDKNLEKDMLAKAILDELEKIIKNELFSFKPLENSESAEQRIWNVING